MKTSTFAVRLLNRLVKMGEKNWLCQTSTERFNLNGSVKQYILNHFKFSLAQFLIIQSIDISFCNLISLKDIHIAPKSFQCGSKKFSN